MHFYESRDWEIKNKILGSHVLSFFWREVSDVGWRGKLRQTDDMSKDADCVRDESQLPC